MLSSIDILRRCGKMESTHTHDDWFISGFHEEEEEKNERREKRRCLADDDAFACRACSGERADEAAAGTAKRKNLPD